MLQCDCTAINTLIVNNSMYLFLLLLRMSALYLTSIRNQGNTYLQQLEDQLKSHPDHRELINLAQYWVDSCILLVDPAILACRDIPLLQPFGVFLSIEFSRRFQIDAHKITQKFMETNCAYDCKVQFISELLSAFARPPVCL